MVITHFRVTTTSAAGQDPGARISEKEPEVGATYPQLNSTKIKHPARSELEFLATAPLQKIFCGQMNLENSELNKHNQVSLWQDSRKPHLH